MLPFALTRRAVYAAAEQCSAERVQVVLDDPPGGRRAVDAAFTAWRAERGQSSLVRLTFTAEGQAVFDYITDVDYD